jgi:hypothetical protein
MLQNEEMESSDESEDGDEPAVEVKYDHTLRPLGIEEDLYQICSDAFLLPRLEECRNPDLNTISH